MGDIGTERVHTHPILGPIAVHTPATVTVDGRILPGIAGEPLAMTLMAHGILAGRTLPGSSAPRGYFCGIGRCADCVMTVNGELNVRTCVTALRDGMIVLTQHGLGSWEDGA